MVQSIQFRNATEKVRCKLNRSQEQKTSKSCKTFQNIQLNVKVGEMRRKETQEKEKQRLFVRKGKKGKEMK